MKIAGREKPKPLRRHMQRPSTWQGRSAQILLNHVGCESRKIPAAGEVFFLTFPFIELARSCALRFRSRNCDFADYMDNKFCLKRSQVAPARMRCVSDCLRQFGVRHWRAVEFTLEHYVGFSRSIQEVFQLLLVTVRMQCEFHPGAPVGTGSILQYSHF